MKTKKELREAEIARYLWNKKKDIIIPIVLFVAIVVVSIWKWDRFVDIYTVIKIYLISIGIGYCIGMNLCYLLLLNKENMIANARFRHQQRYQNFWTRYLQNLSEEEREKLPEKIRLRDNKSAVERIMLYNEFDPYSR